MPVREEKSHHTLLQGPCLLSFRGTKCFLCSSDIVICHKDRWQWSFQAILASRNGIHLWWIGNVYTLILVLFNRKSLTQGQPHFSGEQSTQTMEQLASSPHDATGVSDLQWCHQEWKTLSFSYLRIPWAIFSCKSQHLSKLGSYHPTETIKKWSNWSTLGVDW